MSEGQGGPQRRVRFLTVVEVADLMRVSRMTVYRLVHAGELPAVRVGRSFRVPQDALDAYLRSSATVEPEGYGESRRTS
ncbi:DNA binding domain protein, excisionase family [Cellulomonas flavigena DSM 20109]|uniref:DNA binding domain protein, excisionase family n=1 Tax=Cellulomonas flavigena (strain ATCC 482 / DSM 20109 / BCRC 11376 / JCM 18109 / NBRC 3775 / NCIMB 8073 / NRS 134) TaxID=446466 RepID=D5UJJ2_CELFN|nr:helix-turn-helix domain-containing protein [Cellulomonas flavigena]ADG75630.1 DNA binding domain protein, excisionase family [Cellulomonas flavigena DSM 20109]